MSQLETVEANIGVPVFRNPTPDVVERPMSGASCTELSGRDACERFVEIIAGNVDKQLCWRILHDAKEKPALGKREGTLHALWEEFESSQAEGYSPFIVVNGGGHRDDDITDIRAVFVDADELPLKGMTWHVSPDFIVRRDATHWHAYWLVVDLTPEEFRGVQRRLAVHYGTDRTVGNPSRIMRLPGFLHLKNPDMPKKIELLDLTGGKSGELLPLTNARNLKEVTFNLPEAAVKDKPATKSQMRGDPIELATFRTILSYIDPAMAEEQDQWVGMAKAIRWGQLQLTSDEGIDWNQLLDEWCSGKLWIERTGDDSFGPSTYQGFEELLKRTGDPPRETGRTIGIGTFVSLARANGYKGRALAIQEMFGEPLASSPTQQGTDSDEELPSLRVHTFKQVLAENAGAIIHH